MTGSHPFNKPSSKVAVVFVSFRVGEDGRGHYSLCYQFPRRYTQAGTSRAGFLHTLCTNRASRRGSPSHRHPGLQDPEFSLRQSPPQPLLEIKQKAHQKLPKWARKKLILTEGGLFCSIPLSLPEAESFLSSSKPDPKEQA